MEFTVEKPREQVADAEALLDLTRTLVGSVKSLANEGVTPSQFVSSLLIRYAHTQHSIDWHKLGLAASPIFLSVHGSSTMSVPLLFSFHYSIILLFSYNFASFTGLVPWTTSLSNAKLECPETAILAKLQLLDLYRSLPFDYRTKGPFKFIMCMKIKCCTHWLFVCIYALLFVSSRLMRLLLRKILIPTKTWPLCFTS